MADNSNPVPQGTLQSADPQKIVDMAMQIVKSRVCRGKTLQNPTDAKEYFALTLGKFEREVFTCLFLDSQHRVMAAENLFYGTIDTASVYPREVVKSALKHNSAAVIFAHNHPSGISEPSAADRMITRRLKDALSLIDVKVVDHIIVGEGEILSMVERGLV